MKAFFASNDRRAIKSEHRHDAHLDGQMVVIDCNHKLETVRIDMYKKGQTYYCCLWVQGQESVDVTGSGKGKTRFNAVYAALDSAGICFNSQLPEPAMYSDFHIWDKLERFASAIAEAAGAENCYIHNCLRSN